jgi:hypothetical protein
MKRVECLKVLALAGACCIATTAAKASVLVSMTSRTAVTGGFDYTYQASLSPDQQLNTAVQPNFFTIYDFGPATLVSSMGTGTFAGSNWSFLLNSNLTTAAEGVTPNNDPNIADVRATYSGPVVTGSGTVGNLGTFTLFTTDTGPFAIQNDKQDAQAVKFAPGEPTNDTPVSNLAAIATPTFVPVMPMPMPEPGTLALMTAGVLGVALVRRSRA